MTRKPHSVTIETSIWERAKSRHSSNMSNYVESLIVEDLERYEIITAEARRRGGD